MLGLSIADPEEVESGGVVDGLGWLDITTRMLPTKVTQLVEAHALHVDAGIASDIQGYYIHMGETERGQSRPCFQVRPVGIPDPISRSWSDCLDGAMNHNGLIWGTYIHGVFDQPGFRRAWLNQIRRRKGWSPLNCEVSERVSRRFDQELDRWADHLTSHLHQIDVLRIKAEF